MSDAIDGASQKRTTMKHRRYSGLLTSILSAYARSATGAVSCQPGASPQESDSISSSAEERESMDQLVVRPIRIEGEARFQRWRLGVYRILGRCPRISVNAAPLALDTTVRALRSGAAFARPLLGERVSAK